MEKWKVELTAGWSTLAEMKIQRNIIERDSLLSELFVGAGIPLNYIIRKCTRGYKFTKSQEKINHVMYTDNIKLFTKD